MIRNRDPICVKCHFLPTSDCSHYWERHHSATRFDPDNADGLCRICHGEWEGRKNGYKEFKISQLGKEQFDALERRHNSIMQRDTAIINFMKLKKVI
jgi:hypothetical protein